MTVKVYAILLAAGRSNRMRGLDKLTEEIDGTPLLVSRIKMLLDSHVTGVIVVVPDNRPERLTLISDLPVSISINENASTGMASSIKSGINALPPAAGAALLMPADMPDLTSDDINALLNHHQATRALISRATDADGTAGSPVVFSKSVFPELSELGGEESGRKILSKAPDRVSHVALPDRHATTDLDTPEDWNAWRHRNA